MISALKILAALWPKDAATAELPGAGAGDHVATLDPDTGLVSWQPRGQPTAQFIAASNGDPDDPGLFFLYDANGSPYVMHLWTEL